MNILHFFKKKQEDKQNLIAQHEGIHTYMKRNVGNQLSDFTVDENVYHAYVEKNTHNFSIACDEYGYQVSIFRENRFDIIGKYSAAECSEHWNKEDDAYEAAKQLLGSFYTVTNKKIS